ncbi:TolC family protein [Brassicibacter mesophilus]|uniref:TolC family protein n=1 Tax=Brassicibacter mesophilus TaxID=745119 RepID=UPI003D1ADF3D
MKKIISIVMILTLVFSAFTSVYADSSIDTKQEKGSIEMNKQLIKLSLTDAIEYALNNNTDIKIQDLNIEKQKVSYDEDMKSVRTSKRVKEVLGNYSAPIEQVVAESLIELGVVKRSAKLSLQIANWNKEIKTNEIKYNVEKGYFDLLQAQKELDIAKEGLELAKKQYDQSKLMYDLGTISQQQLVAIELGVSQAQTGVNGANMAYEFQKMNFNQVLGLSLDQDIILTDSIEYKEHKDIDLDSSIEEALENNVSLDVAEESYELSELTLDAIKTGYLENTYKYREQAVVVERAAKSLESAKTGIEMAVRSAYLNLMTSEKQIATYEKAVEKAQKALELAQVSFELGQNTANDVTQARIELMDAKKNLSKQIHAYNMALLDFKYSTGLGKTLIG